MGGQVAVIKAPTTDREIQALLEIHKKALPPEMVLWAVVLLDAMAVLRGIIVGPSTGELGLTRKAGFDNMYEEYVQRERRWFASEDDAPGTFRWICEELKLDRMAIRRGLRSNGGGVTTR